MIEGEEAYKLGKSFMKTLIPSKSSLVKKYKNNTPILNHYGIEKDIDLIFKSEVSLKSGGSIVINPTEALVSIDVNSGRSTNERDIEPTAVKTNVEAAKEIARQLRLRDLGGLIVIDFIDMNIRKNNYLVENTLKNSFRKDKAKIQIGRISNFGLMEMSRQRLRPSLLEINFKECSVCGGLGLIRSIESQSLQIIRHIELLLKSSGKKSIKVEINPKMSEYLLNFKSSIFSNNKDNYGSLIKIVVNNNFEENIYKISSENLSILSNIEEEDKPEKILKSKKNKALKKINSIKSKSIKQNINNSKEKSTKKEKKLEKKNVEFEKKAIIKKSIKKNSASLRKVNNNKTKEEKKIPSKKLKPDEIKTKGPKKVGWWKK